MIQASPALFAKLATYKNPATIPPALQAQAIKTWYWVCFGGIIFFLLTIPLLRGRWKPADARRDEAEHEAIVTAELAKLGS